MLAMEASQLRNRLNVLIGKSTGNCPAFDRTSQAIHPKLLGEPGLRPKISVPECREFAFADLRIAEQSAG
jgi:hypothetical protein